MTYREYIEKTTSKFNITSDEIDVILVNQQELIPDTTAEVDPKVAKKALVREFASLIAPANISEGGYSISWNIEAIKLWYYAMCEELGIAPAGKPRIKNRSNIW